MSDGSVKIVLSPAEDGRKGSEDEHTADALVETLGITLAAIRDALVDHEARATAAFETVAALEEQLASKDQQLTAKDRQIEELRRLLADQSKTLFDLTVKKKGLVPHLRVLLFGLEGATAS